jgi:very-short-patch-repair endonuclease
LRRAVEHAEPLAESPMESRLRMLLVLRGLPRPLAQVPIVDSGGEFAGRPDLFYPDQRLGLEYDGAGHRESLVDDNRRQNRLLSAGVRLLRFAAADIWQRPDEVAGLVAAHLGRANRAA